MLRRAIELFNTQGYDATSMGDLARELGFSKSAIYHHVPSKEHLLALALDEALGELTEIVETATGPGAQGAAYDRLRAVVSQSVEVLVAHQPAVTLLLRVRGNSEVELDALRRRRAIDGALAGLVQQAVRRGSTARRRAAGAGQPAAVRDGELAGRVVPPRPVGGRRGAVPGRHRDGVRGAERLGATLRTRRTWRKHAIRLRDPGSSCPTGRWIRVQPPTGRPRERDRPRSSAITTLSEVRRTVTS